MLYGHIAFKLFSKGSGEMNRHNRNISLFLSLVMIFSIVISPFTVAEASAPTAPRTPTRRTIEDTFLETPADIKIPSISTPKIDPNLLDLRLKNRDRLEREIGKLEKVETAARAQGVTYKLKDGVEKLPETINYDLEQIRLDDMVAYEGGAKVTEQEAIDPKKFKGLRHNPGSKYMVLPKDAASTFTPKLNKIYIDEVEGLAYKVTESGETDSAGNKQYVVETPELTEVFESYTIPKQDIKLTTGNIAYIAPGVELDPASGMTKNYLAASDKGFISNVEYDGSRHILHLTPGKMIFQYPSKEEQEKTEKEKEEAKKKKFEGDWWEKEQYSDLRDFEEESELKVEIKIKEGTIVIEDPTFHADFDLNWLTTRAVADFYFESKTVADVIFEGNLKFNKTVETCIFGYDIDLGSVMGKEKGNRAFVGIFLVLGANGQVNVEVRTIATGNARAGFAYKAFAYGLVPYFVGPYVTYRPTGFDATFSASGELHAVLACVPQVGVIIWGVEIGALQIWLGLKGDAEFDIKGGGGTGTDGEITGKGSLDLSAFAEMVGFLFGKRYSIFYIDFPIYKGEWVVGEEVSGGAGDLIREVTASFLVKADASTNIVEGKVLIDNGSIPYAKRDIDIEIYNWKTDKYKITLRSTTDDEGNFNINTGSYNLLPSDYLIFKITPGDVYEKDNKKYKVTGQSREIYPIVPYTEMDFNVDPFNDVITGVVSGQYNGPVDLEVVHWDWTRTKYTANAVNGVFSLMIPIKEKTRSVEGYLIFEGEKYPDPEYNVRREPNLDALEIVFINEYEPEVETDTETDTEQQTSTIRQIRSTRPRKGDARTNETNTQEENTDDKGNKLVKPIKIIGSITNKADMGLVEVMGEDYVRNPELNNMPVKPYLGNVKIEAIPLITPMMNILNGGKYSHVTDPLAAEDDWTATVQAKQVVMDGKATGASSFEFIDPQALHYSLEIEHEGYKKKVYFDPFEFHVENTVQKINEFANRPFQKEIRLITEERIESVVNPADNLLPGDIMRPGTEIMNPGDMMNPGNRLNPGDIMNPGNLMTPGNTMNQQNNAPDISLNNLTPGVTMKQSVKQPATTNLNQWNAKWATKIGTMDLKLNGTSISGTLLQGKTSMQIEGKIVDGIFKGTIMVPTQKSLFGDIVTFEMKMSSDGKTIEFNNFGNNELLKSLNGTKATRQ